MRASILIASGLNAKAVSVLMGHSSIAVTFDTYGHLFEGSEAEAAELVAAYLEAQQERAAERVRRADPRRALGDHVVSRRRSAQNSG